MLSVPIQSLLGEGNPVQGVFNIPVPLMRLFQSQLNALITHVSPSDLMPDKHPSE